MESCKCCEQWKEHYYWTHMRPKKTQFFKIMTGNFSTSLKLPTKFVDCYKGSLSETLHLKGPSNRTWKVELIKAGGDVFMQSGWTEFVEAHDVEDEDILIFKYDGNCCFDVLIFERSGCEKASAFFAKGRHSRRQETVVDSVEVVSSSPPRRGDPKGDSSSSHHAFKWQASPSPDSSEFPGDNPRAKRNKSTSFDKELTGEEPHRKKANDGPANRCEQEPTEMHEELTIDSLYLNKRTQLTEEEQNRVMQLVEAIEPVNPFFISIMRASHVHKRFFMTVPCEFIKEHMSPRNRHETQDMILQVPGRNQKWTVGFLAQQTVSGFSAKWSKFVSDNQLEIGDICLFEMVRARRPVTITVHIFRRGENVPSVTISNDSEMFS